MSQTETSAPDARPRIKVGLIGAEIQASKSPALHVREAAFHSFDYSYELIDLAVRKCGAEAPPLILNEVEDGGFAGVNVTFPVKQAFIDISPNCPRKPAPWARSTPSSCWTGSASATTRTGTASTRVSV